jgi:nucleotide-binding universal stress UspA family protein
MIEYKLKAAPTAVSKEQNSQKEPKANRILIGVDVHLKSYQAAHKIDNGAVGVAQTFGSKEAFLLYVEKQQELAKEVVVLYEAGPLGYKLYRELKVSDIECLVCAPRSGEQKRKRRKNNSIDARTLTSDLFNYLNGNEHALQRVRVPTETQEQARVQSRQQDALVEERKRIGAIGNALLLSQGYGSWSNWWRPKAFERLSKEVASWIVKHLGRSCWGFTRAGPTNSTSQGGVEPEVARTQAQRNGGCELSAIAGRSTGLEPLLKWTQARLLSRNGSQ